MLKKSSSFVLALNRSSTYPTRKTSCFGSSGWAGEEGYACGLFFGCGLAWRQGREGGEAAFLSIRRECSSVVPHVETIEVLARRHSLSKPASVPGRAFLTDNDLIAI